MDYKIVDLSYLNMLADGDPDFINEMITTFIANTPELIDEMKTALGNKEYVEVGRVAHKIKPTITFMGIHSFEDKIKTLEAYGKEASNIDQIEILVKELEETCDAACAELKAGQ